MLKTIIVLSLFWLSAAVSSPLALAYIILDAVGLGALLKPAIGGFSHLWGKGVLWVVGAKTTVSGLENVPSDEKLVFFANHQGDLDIVMMLAFMPRPVGFIAKSEAAWFPFINIWIAAIHSSFVNRRSPRQGKRAIDHGVRNVERGHSLVIFPEGTRSRGPELLPFRNGSFKLATRSGATIVPVTINGSYKVWEAHKRIESADVRIVVHPPIRTAGLDIDGRKALPDLVRAAIASAL